MYFALAYIDTSLCKRNYGYQTSHIFITLHFSAVKFNRGNEKNTSLLLIPKSQKVGFTSQTQLTYFRNVDDIKQQLTGSKIYGICQQFINF